MLGYGAMVAYQTHLHHQGYVHESGYVREPSERRPVHSAPIRFTFVKCAMD
eukprot:SAG31_NODE_28638_length_407_cov_0.834416_1_plen_50_part_10